MRMLKKALIALAVLVLLFLGIIVSRPAEFRIERSATIDAPPEVAFALVNDFHKWTDWSPWEHLDANMQRTHSGAPAGVGAVYHWVGNDDVGEGEMAITASTPPEQLVIKLDFIKPFPANNTITFTFAKVTEGTKVTWAMEGKNGFMGKAFSMVMNMDQLVGRDFDKGLASLRGLAETEAKKAAAPPAPEPPPEGADAGTP